MLKKENPFFRKLADEVKGVTVSARGKEGAEDYRYFPDPVVTFFIKGEMIEEIKSELLSYHYRERGS